MTPEVRAEQLFDRLDAVDMWTDEARAGSRPGVIRELARAVAAAVSEERERCAMVAERTARMCELKAGGEPARETYSLTYAAADKHTAAELRDVALLIRERR